MQFMHFDGQYANTFSQLLLLWNWLYHVLQTKLKKSCTEKHYYTILCFIFCLINNSSVRWVVTTTTKKQSLAIL